MTPELLIDDREFLVPIYGPVQKFDESQHRRDAKGKFIDKAFITVGDRQIEVVKPLRAIRAGDKLVPLNVVAFDAAFQREAGFYLGVGGGPNAIHDRYPAFGEFIAEHDSMEASEVTVNEDGKVGFTNGRHRYAWLRDQGLTSIPVSMDPESVKHAKKHGYLAAVKLAWDESEHPRDEKGKFKGLGAKLWQIYADRMELSPAEAEEFLDEREDDSLAEEMKDLAEVISAHLSPAELEHLTRNQPTVAFKGALPVAADTDTDVVYHGTTAEAAHRITTEGALKPRGERAGNWERGPFGGNPSNPELVYVTPTQEGAEIYSKEIARRAGGVPAVIRLKPDWKRAVPDEDVIWDLLDRTRPSKHAQKWDESQHPRDTHGRFSDVPAEPGTTPIPPGKIRGYHYTGDMDAVEQDGLNVSKAQGAGYGEPNAIWFSTAKPSNHKEYVEVFLDPSDIAMGAGPLRAREDPTSPEALAKIEDYNKGDHDFMVYSKGIPPDRFVSTHRPWHDHYRYFEENPESATAVLAGEFDDLLDDPDHGPAIRKFKETHVQKSEHSYGNTQIQIDPASSAAASLNAARATIADADCMADGKDVDPNHVTVRYGLENDDLDGLRAYLSTLAPFEARVLRVELFPASEHSDGAVPVVALIASPELRQIEQEIGKHADFKEKSFPTYKPHCTLAYVKPEKAEPYGDLYVDGSFVVSAITISHKDDRQEVVHLGRVQKFDPSQPRDEGGRWTERGADATIDIDTSEETRRNFSDVGRDVVAVLERRLSTGERVGVMQLLAPRPYHHPEYLVVGDVNVPAKHQRQGHASALYDSALRTAVKLGYRGVQSGDVNFVSGQYWKKWVESGRAKEITHRYQKVLVRDAPAQKKDPVSGRYVTPFVSFDKQGDESLRMIASLNSSRLATWGFTAEAEVLGMARYRLTAVLDGRTSKFCRLIDGKIFNVPDARRKVIEVLEVQDPNDLKVVQPWPKQTKAAMAEWAQMSSAELTERGLHIPPYHPHCRTICRAIQTSAGESTEVVPTVPGEAEAFHAVTADDLKELGIDATPEQVDQWNEHVGMTPVELLSKFSGLPPQEVMTKGQGVGANPIRFEDNGNIGFNVRGSSPQGLEFKLGAILDPFTGTYYLTRADLEAGNPKAELAFLKQMFSALIEMGLKSTATEVAVGVAGNAAYYARLGFLPDELEWEELRTHALSIADPLLASLQPDDRLLVEHLLQDHSVSALSALVELPFTYEGKTIGEWLFGEATGTWGLDLTDDLLVAQAKGYLV